MSSQIYNNRKGFFVHNKKYIVFFLSYKSREMFVLLTRACLRFFFIFFLLANICTVFLVGCCTKPLFLFVK